ncbi:ABC transporter ATP-binding protein/permease [Crossiella sp. SN42]|uniref:ABC transporter ATP-binding protein n=1 Tax=Crossiella sp. SN42 TaxID=2944808 RepID=UPI00207C3D0C|nr:ABC transporter ATP-binding protein [Crossiella sp. SN42]MCO1580504.1 ABC transporter ATP-binding protein/permease [Crossiella sp. SN42]
MPVAAAHQPLRILHELTRGRRGQLALVVLLSLVATAGTLALPLLVSGLIAAVQTRQDLLWRAVAMSVAALGGAAAAAGSSYLLARLGERMVHRLRSRIMAHVLRLPLRTVREHGSGDLLARVTADSAQLRTIADLGVVQLPTAVVTAVGTLVVMAVLDPVLLVAALGGFLVAGLLIGLVVTGLRRAHTRYQSALGRLAHRLTTVLDALPMVKACRAEQRLSVQLAQASHETSAAALGAVRLEALMSPVLGLGQQIGLVAVVVTGGARFVAGSLAVADLVAFLLCLLQLVAPIMMISMGAGQVQAGLAARGRFDEILALSTEDAGDPPHSTVPLPSDAPAVAFRAVGFAHDQRPVLRGVDLDIPRHGLTALLGESGAGKTTTLALIERFLQPDTGSVWILGRDSRQWPLAELRGRIAYLDQEFTLLAESVRANLTVGHLDDVPEPELWRALERVALADAVRALPEGLDTVLGGAIDLSGGQRQRLALARVSLSTAEIVLLDEPTSQLDSGNEELLRATIDTLAADRAVLVVAHRLSTVRHAAKVILLADGQVQASGSHEQVLLTSPAYRELLAAQSVASR